MEMVSHEENLHNMIKISKMATAKEQARSAASVIRDKQREQQRMGQSPSGMGGGGSDSFSSGQSGNYDPTSITATPKPAPYVPAVSVAASSSRAPAVKGMSLSAMGGKNKSLEEALYKEDKLAPVILTSKTAPVQDVIVAPPTIQQPIMLAIVENVDCTMNTDGNVESVEIKGSLTLTAMTEETALCAVQLDVGDVQAFIFNTHPKVNKALYDSSGLLQLKDATKGFPAQRPVGILKWTYVGSNDDMVPIKINCWPEEESRGQMNVTIEYSVDKKVELNFVRIKIPLGCTETPNILSIDGSHTHNSSAGELVWEIDLIDQSNSTGSLEFNIAQRSSDVFFPIQVSFVSKKTLCNLSVKDVRSATGNTPIQYGMSKSMNSGEYTIG
jgi:hypothetical protein